MISNKSLKNVDISAKDREIYPSTETRHYLQRQNELYKQFKPQLLDKYAGMYIIFEDGKVIDADKNEAELVMRAYEKMGIRDLFVKKVLENEPNLIARVPFTLE
jgi:hypothetical protein